MADPDRRARTTERISARELSHAGLEQPLGELRNRVVDVLNTQERLKVLLDRVMEVGAGLELRGVLARVTQSACQLVNAHSGVLAVFGPERTVVDVIAHGLSTAAAERMSRRPPSDRMLVVPVHIRDQPFGNIYLSDKAEDAEFTEEDEEAMLALARAAGIAIENAQLYGQELRRQRWQQAAAEINQKLVDELDRDDALALVVSHSRDISGADLGALVLVDPGSDDSDLVLEVVDGMGMEGAAGQGIPRRGIIGQVMDSGETVVVDDVSTDERLAADSPLWRERLSRVGRALFTPLTAPGEVLGVLAVAWRRESLVAHDDGEVQLVAAFAGQAALALARLRAYEVRQQLLLLEDRDRIARDLHDLVIQRLFATGMRLQLAVQLSTRPPVQQRINEAIDALDETVRDIRDVIFRLQQPAGRTLRVVVNSELDEASEVLGFRPGLVVHGPLEAGVPDRLRDPLVAVLREGLTNVARHAGAQSAQVEISVGAELVVRISDDGRGPGDSTRQSGVGNLAARARHFGGVCDLRAGEAGGTVLEWRAPASG